MRISDWSSDVCSSDLRGAAPARRHGARPARSTPRQGQAGELGLRTDQTRARRHLVRRVHPCRQHCLSLAADAVPLLHRSEEHTSELQSLMRISYAVFCLKKKNNDIKIY